MNRRTAIRLFAVGVLALCLVIPLGWFAAAPGSAGYVLLLLGITEGPDPIEGLSERFSDLPEGIANPGGTARGDGRIDLALAPAGHHAIAVWAYGTGSDHDIALREWDGLGWKEIDFLSSDATDELDPRAFIEADGTVWVTWWIAQGSGKIMVARRDPVTGNWDEPESAGASGSKPSVIVHDGRRLVAFEREVGSAKKLVLSSRTVGGQQSTEVLAETDWIDGPMEIMLHKLDGRLWIDWQHSDTLFGYSEFVGGGWVAPRGDLPWAERSWNQSISRSIQEGTASN